MFILIEHQKLFIITVFTKISIFVPVFDAFFVSPPVFFTLVQSQTWLEVFIMIRLSVVPAIHSSTCIKRRNIFE